MATIVFVMLPETGHINAGFKLAKSLKSRGHRVYYLGLREFEAAARAQGLEFFSLFESVYERGRIAAQASRAESLRNFDLFQTLLLAGATDRSPEGLARMLAEEISRVVSALSPDLFVVDALLPDFALMLTRMRLPGALLHTILYNDLEDGDPAYAPIYGMPELVLWPKEFDFPRRGQEARRFHYLEASVDLERAEGAFDWGRVPADKPLIYCSLGSQSHLYVESRPFFQAAIDAVAARPDWQMILAVGHHLKESDFRNVPPNVLLVGSVPQLQVLRRASVMITHGGINSIKECVFHGVPMIIFPISGDQPMNAARIEYHGLGVRGNLRKTSAEKIASLIARVTQNPAYRERVGAMRERFVEVENSGVGVRVVEGLVESSWRGQRVTALAS